MSCVTAGELDFDLCYRAIESRDARFDGWFIVGVRTTGVYCRPSCPSPVRPKRENVAFYKTAAAAQRAGLRACKRCRPDATPGSPEWDTRGDLVGRAMRLIADGVVDRDGVRGLARALDVSERHLHRLLEAEVGAPPLALARSQRAQTARVLIEGTRLPFSEIAFAAGFRSIRQFNDTVREVFAATPTELRRVRRRGDAGAPGRLVVRLPLRPPYDGAGVLAWLAARTVPGMEEVAGGVYRRTLRLPAGSATVALEPADDHVRATLRLDTVADLAAAVHRCRRLLDLDADPRAYAAVLGADAALARRVAANPGLRAPGTVDAAESAVRTVLGQQVSLAAARTLAGRLVAACGAPLADPDGALTHAFPTPAAIAGDGALATIGLPRGRQETLRTMCDRLAGGDLVLDDRADRADVRGRLLAIPGVGPWTADYIALRALGDPDAFPAGDLGLRRAARGLGLPADAAALEARSERWRPWRRYAAHHLWAVGAGAPRAGRPPRRDTAHGARRDDR
jgi:AraC family transcriptional regulator, regulatory protein of adaptative response / DNA-3-methyladenine glycosylase II